MWERPHCPHLLHAWPTTEQQAQSFEQNEQANYCIYRVIMCVCQHYAPVDPLLCVSDLCYIVLLSYLIENKKFFECLVFCRGFVGCAWHLSLVFCSDKRVPPLAIICSFERRWLILERAAWGSDRDGDAKRLHDAIDAMFAEFVNSESFHLLLPDCT